MSHFPRYATAYTIEVPNEEAADEIAQTQRHIASMRVDLLVAGPQAEPPRRPVGLLELIV